MTKTSAKPKNPFTAIAERLWPKKFVRRHERHQCDMDVELLAGLRYVGMKGRLYDISLGGALFRPDTLYLMIRDGETAVLKIRHVEINARIVRTIPMGYSLQFGDDINDEILASVLVIRDAEQAAAAEAARAA